MTKPVTKREYVSMRAARRAAERRREMWAYIVKVIEILAMIAMIYCGLVMLFEWLSAGGAN